MGAHSDDTALHICHGNEHLCTHPLILTTQEHKHARRINTSVGSWWGPENEAENTLPLMRMAAAGRPENEAL
jgi:hypothetical protein